jgi:hypothetical protein
MARLQVSLYIENKPETRLSSSVETDLEWIWLRLGPDFVATISLEQAQHLIKELSNSVAKFQELAE